MSNLFFGGASSCQAPLGFSQNALFGSSLNLRHPVPPGEAFPKQHFVLHVSRNTKPSETRGFATTVLGEFYCTQTPTGIHSFNGLKIRAIEMNWYCTPFRQVL